MDDAEWWESIKELEKSFEECRKAIRNELSVLPNWIQKIIFFCYPFLREEQDNGQTVTIDGMKTDWAGLIHAIDEMKMMEDKIQDDENH